MREASSPGKSGLWRSVYPGLKSVRACVPSPLPLTHSLPRFEWFHLHATGTPTLGNGDTMPECDLFQSAGFQNFSALGWRCLGTQHDSSGCGLKPSLFEALFFLFCFVLLCVSVYLYLILYQVSLRGQQPLPPPVCIHSPRVTWWPGWGTTLTPEKRALASSLSLWPSTHPMSALRLPRNRPRRMYVHW